MPRKRIEELKNTQQLLCILYQFYSRFFGQNIPFKVYINTGFTGFMIIKTKPKNLKCYKKIPNTIFLLSNNTGNMAIYCYVQ